MATTTTPTLGSSLGCQIWATIDCTDTADAVVTATAGPTLACGSCAARHDELAAVDHAAAAPF